MDTVPNTPAAEGGLDPTYAEPTPREWQHLAAAALPSILAAEPPLPVVDWHLASFAGSYIPALRGQAAPGDDHMAVVHVYAEFLGVEAELYHGGDRIRARGVHLGCPVEVWGITPQLREKEREQRAAKPTGGES